MTFYHLEKIRSPSHWLEVDFFEYVLPLIENPFFPMLPDYAAEVKRHPDHNIDWGKVFGMSVNGYCSALDKTYELVKEKFLRGSLSGQQVTIMKKKANKVYHYRREKDEEMDHGHRNAAEQWRKLRTSLANLVKSYGGASEAVIRSNTNQASYGWGSNQSPDDDSDSDTDELSLTSRNVDNPFSGNEAGILIGGAILFGGLAILSSLFGNSNRNRRGNQ